MDLKYNVSHSQKSNYVKNFFLNHSFWETANRNITSLLQCLNHTEASNAALNVNIPQSDEQQA
jgi:broad specificity polyphosphatase/5'/3'-nucleotidase SurE